MVGYIFESVCGAPGPTGLRCDLHGPHRHHRREGTAWPLDGVPLGQTRRLLVTAETAASMLPTLAKARGIGVTGLLFGASVESRSGRGDDTWRIDFAPAIAFGGPLDLGFEGAKIARVLRRRAGLFFGFWVGGHGRAAGPEAIAAIQQVMGRIPPRSAPVGDLALLELMPDGIAARIVSRDDPYPLRETKPATTTEAVDLGWVECRTCGYRAAEPEPHYFMPPNVVCTAKDGDWMTPARRGPELPRQESFPTFSPHAPRRQRSGRA